MSLILDALRKMEQERKSRQGAAVDIRPEVLRYQGAPQPQQARPQLPIAIGVLLLAAGIGAGIFLKGDGPAEVARAVPAASLPQSPAAAAPVAGGVAAEAPALPAPHPGGSAGGAQLRPGEPSPGAVSSPAAGKGSSRRVEIPAAAPKPPASEAPVPQAKPLPESVVQTPAILADISVSGIAYQDERSLRRAVLNGSLVGEGGEVAGARVVEIREDKVRLSRGGQIYEVVLSSGFHSR